MDILNVTNIFEDNFTGSDIFLKKSIVDSLLQKQKTLLLTKTKLSNDKEILRDNFQKVDQKLSLKADLKEILKYKRYVDKIDQIVNLVFGLEIRLQDAKNADDNSYNIQILSRRLVEACSIKSSHDISLQTVGRIVMDRLGYSSQMGFCKAVRWSKENGCKLRIVSQEIYYCQTQIKLINMFN